MTVILAYLMHVLVTCPFANLLQIMIMSPKLRTQNVLASTVPLLLLNPLEEGKNGQSLTIPPMARKKNELDIKNMVINSSFMNDKTIVNMDVTNNNNNEISNIITKTIISLLL